MVGIQHLDSRDEDAAGACTSIICPFPSPRWTLVKRLLRVGPWLLLETLDMGWFVGRHRPTGAALLAYRALWSGPDSRMGFWETNARAWSRRGFCLNLMERAPLGVV